MSRTYFTADLHFGHNFVADIRGYDTVGEHDDRIVDTLVATFKPRDVLWVLGDVMGRGSERDYALDRLAIVGRETGVTMRLIAGNHDTCHPMHRSAHREQCKYFPTFESVQEFARIRHNKQGVMLSHFPYEGAGDHTAQERHSQYRLPDKGSPLIHGHTHQEVPTLSERPNQVCVSWDAWGRPASLDEVMGHLRKEANA